MGSHGGQQNLPFGYDVDRLQGIGLPNFLSPGPPAGQPLLNEHDNQTLNSFFSGFEAGGNASKQGHLQPPAHEVSQEQDWLMPPTFVGSETSFRGRAETDWQSGGQADFGFGNDMNLSQMPHSGGYGNVPQNNFMHNQFDGSLLHHIHTVAHGEMVDPHFGQLSWQQSFHDQSGPHMSQKPPMRFGSDQHFQPGGYAVPEGQFVPSAPSLDWLEPHSSATNTQPNTRPNTQPSSPVWTKKRKLDEYQDPSLVSTNSNLVNSAQSTPPVSKPKTSKKRDQAPLTPASGHPSHGKHEDESSDAHFEEDEDDPTSPASGSWPANKARSSKIKDSSNKGSRSRRKSIVSSTPVKLKSKASRSGAAVPAVSTSTTRVPLTADQKKANHTNSEQRRRDATAKAYAELYDLIPELNDLGKQSTMKKLEVVVDKVAQVKERVTQLRSLLGMDVETGAPQTGHSIYPSRGAAGMTNMFDAGVSWQRDRSDFT